MITITMAVCGLVENLMLGILPCIICLSQNITCIALFLEKDHSFLVSFVYAHNDASDRVSLRHITSLSCASLPWCMVGDFNCMVDLCEVVGGREHSTSYMQVFKDCITYGLGHVLTCGVVFTWTNCRPHNTVLKGLGRMLANAAWFLKFTEGNVVVENMGIMDHCPLLYVEPMCLDRFGKRFQFFNYILDISDFLDVVANAWNTTFTGDPMVIFWNKLKTVKGALRDLSRNHGNVHFNVLATRAQLDEIQERIKSNISAELLVEEKMLINKLNVALLEEEHVLLQKSRVKWLDKGDGNTGFIFQQTKAHRNVNKVLALIDAENNLVHGQAACAKVVIDYFSEFSGKNTLGSSQSIDLSSVHYDTISMAQAAMLEALVTADLIHKNLKHMKKNKASGPDGVNVEFFMTTWDIVGRTFCRVQYFFSYGHLHQGLNSTFITLIPKVSSPSNMTDFRPISLCARHKCISKIIATRLKVVLPLVIDQSQSSFIPRRSISDNIFLAQELFRGYDRATGTPRCALKVDVYKAFDSLQWSFITVVLQKMSFPFKVIKWIVACICTPSYSIKLNGVIHGYFKGAQGIRQGDPMSPYIFTTCMNILSCLLKHKPVNF